MNADEFLRQLTNAIFLLIFVVVAVQAIRRPRRASLDIALFFGALALLVVWQFATNLGLPPHPVTTVFLIAAFLALPYMLLRLLDDFTGISPWLMRAAEVGLALTTIAFAASSAP